MNDLDNEGRNPEEGGSLNSVEKLPPALVSPPPALHQLLRTHPRHRLRHHSPLPVAIHLQPPVLTYLLFTAHRSEAARQGVVVHQKGREGGTEAFDRDGLAEDIEVLDGEAQEPLLVQVRQVERVLWCGLAGDHQHGLRRVVAVRNIYGFLHLTNGCKYLTNIYLNLMDI